MVKRTLKKSRSVTVETITLTCPWVPAQWEGYTADKRPMYVRYRWGQLSIRLGPVGGTILDAVRSKSEIVNRSIGDPLDGVMSYQQLKRLTRGLIAWPRTQHVQKEF